MHQQSNKSGKHGYCNMMHTLPPKHGLPSPIQAKEDTDAVSRSYPKTLPHIVFPSTSISPCQSLARIKLVTPLFQSCKLFPISTYDYIRGIRRHIATLSDEAAVVVFL